MNEVERLRFMLLCDRVEALEKKVADLEAQVQGQQDNLVGHIENDRSDNEYIISLIQKGLESHANLSKRFA